MRLRSVAICEGAAQDARGFLTLVGYESPAFVVPTFPGDAAPVIVAIFEIGLGEDLRGLGASFRIRTEVSAPDGSVVFLTELVQQTRSEGINPNLPIRFQNVVQAPFVAQKPGSYTARISMYAGEGDPIAVGDVDFLVVDLKAVTPTDAVPSSSPPTPQ
jgi:hypothetical protein